jgi:hypothetical protein
VIFISSAGWETSEASAFVDGEGMLWLAWANAQPEDKQTANLEKRLAKLSAEKKAEEQARREALLTITMPDGKPN